MAILCDDVLGPLWKYYLKEQGRYVFPMLPAVIKGAGVRLRGDGPSSWSRFLVVARPRTREFASWGTLRGAYYGPSERMPWPGGKPGWLMREIVSDYSRAGDMICDPCCGGGTTALAVIQLGRSSISYDIDPKAIEKTAERLSKEAEWLEGGL